VLCGEIWTESIPEIAADAIAFVDANLHVVHPGWHNAGNPYDVTGRDGVTPEDVLRLIAYINSGPNDASLPDPPATGPPYYDVNDDNLCSPQDVLLVINHINLQSAGAAEAEAGSSAISTATSGTASPRGTFRLVPRFDFSHRVTGARRNEGRGAKALQPPIAIGLPDENGQSAESMRANHARRVDGMLARRAERWDRIDTLFAELADEGAFRWGPFSAGARWAG
jgi:hypothetical protein